MQAIHPPKRRNYSERTYGQRKCEDCPAVFVPASANQKRCDGCREEYSRARRRERKAVRRKVRQQQRCCLDCGARIAPSRGRPPLRCPACRSGYYQERGRAIPPEVRKVYNKRWRLANPGLVRELSRKYRQANPETGHAALSRRRQRAEVGMDEVDRFLSAEYRKAIRHDPCFYCGDPETHHVDHYFPLAKGGTDHFFNLVRACRDCNLSKFTTCGTAFLLREGILAVAA